MRRLLIIFTITLSSLSTIIKAQTLNSQEMDGETEMSCSAILCLAASVRPAECVPPVVHYFSIVRRRFWETLQARLDFLNLCPIHGAAGMDGMKSALARGAGQCDAAGLNVGNFVHQGRDDGGYVSDALPDYCSAYFGNQYVRLEVPRYVGTMDRGGFWVEAKDYAVALAAYNKQLAAMDSGRGNSRGGQE